MKILNKIIQLSSQIAVAILKNTASKELHHSDLFTNAQKEHILKEVTDPEKIEERKKLRALINKKDDWRKIQSQINRPVYYLNYLRYAAAILVLAGLGFYFYNNTQKTILDPANAVVTTTVIQPGSDKATLVLGNGKTIVLGQGNVYSANGISANDKIITYEAKSSKIEYNYLTIPRAGQFQLQLADGTKVWLNSDSQLKFPNHFVDGLPRSVDLVYGEAYFEVSPSTHHSGSHFIVKTKGQQVEVLGTEFNIKAYNDETSIYTTLVQGSVALSNKKHYELLKPNHQLIVKLNDQSIENRVVNAQKIVSWKDGVFNFENRSLEEIMKVLGRWYDVKVVFDNSNIKNMKFTGVLRKNQNINDILFTIKTLNNIEYEINQKTVTLAQKNKRTEVRISDQTNLIFSLNIN
ncbi:FecR family protein [Flavobacterium ajazii]|uniref:FecR family protein n=1 Tax=Flavobacterium ajazii TaxID=2692318 RepID=UPI0013D65E40|nr:FecR family protein [Flavobacterium ajazii]